VALGSAVIAAGLLFVLMMVAWRKDLGSPGGSPRPQDDLVTVTPDRDVPDGIESPGDHLADGRGGLRNRPTYILVIDLTITPKGQQSKVFENALKKAGIVFDPSITVDEDLEDVLLRSRFLEGVERAEDAAEEDAAADDVKMVYVTGMGLALDAAITDLMKTQPRDEIAWVKLDLAIDPTERAVFDGLYEASRFATVEPTASPKAQRLVFRFSMYTASGGFLASFPTPRLTAELLPAEEPGEEDAVAAARSPVARQAKPATPPKTPAEQLAPKADGEAGVKMQVVDQLYEVLFILRNIKDAPEHEAEE
jgi:hypothetical protein